MNKLHGVGQDHPPPIWSHDSKIWYTEEQWRAMWATTTFYHICDKYDENGKCRHNYLTGIAEVIEAVGPQLIL